MGSRGSASGSKAYSFDGLKSRNENILAAYNSIRNKGDLTLDDFKEMVDFETRGRDGYNLRDGIDAAFEGYDDQVLFGTAEKNGFNFSESTRTAEKRLSRSRNVIEVTPTTGNRLHVEVRKNPGSASNSLDYVLSGKNFRDYNAAYKYANELAKKYN